MLHEDHNPYYDTERPIYYNPQFLSWCKSYDEEVQEFKDLIESKPSDLKQLKHEFFMLTGKHYKKSFS